MLEMAAGNRPWLLGVNLLYHMDNCVGERCKMAEGWWLKANLPLQTFIKYLAKILILLVLCKYSIQCLPLFYFYFTSTIPLLYFYQLTICCQPKSVHNTLHFLLVVYQLFPTWECFVPSMGMFCSQYGNILFRTWE